MGYSLLFLYMAPVLWVYSIVGTAPVDILYVPGTYCNVILYDEVKIYILYVLCTYRHNLELILVLST